MAIKIIDKRDEDFDDNKDVIDNEAVIVSELPKSPCLVSFYEVIAGLIRN